LICTFFVYLYFLGGQYVLLPFKCTHDQYLNIICYLCTVFDNKFAKCETAQDLLFLDKWFRITLRFNFSNVSITASIYPPLKQTHHCNPHKITFRTGGQVPSKHYTNRNNHIFILTASPNIQSNEKKLNIF
jgi:hypothetical protein